MTSLSKGEPNSTSKVLRAEDMDVVGKLFALRFTKGCGSGCVELYVEDDENYFWKASFDRYWLSDLEHVAKAAAKRKGRK